MLIRLLTILLFLSVGLNAQNLNIGWRKHLKMAKNALQLGHAADAAHHYEQAWLQKKNKLAYLNEAATLYQQSRDYRKAAECWARLKDEPTFPNARLQYAIALKQNGAFDDAIPEFLLYLNNYEGKDRESIADKIEGHIAGATLAIRQSDSLNTRKISVEHLNENVNTPENDLAPIPFADDILYFTGSANGVAKIFRSQQLNGDWSVAQPLQNIKVTEGVDFGNGSFSPDGARFYFTLCAEDKKAGAEVCAIHAIRKQAGGWSQPTKLRDYINVPGATTTQPFVTHKDGKEFLYFVSDRKGGRGKMDIWYTSRPLSTDDWDFDVPENCGGTVNTEGDEVTPFYDVEEGALYFASNGRPTMGGLDIFVSKGFEQRWRMPENAGLPYNSGADDWYFVKNKSKTGGFFVSNRVFGMEKINTYDDDIFSFAVKDRRELSVSGKIAEKSSKALLENARVALFERRERDNLRLLSALMSTNGVYTFNLLPQKNYVIEVEKDGFRLANVEFSTKEGAPNLVKDVFLEKYAQLVTHKVEPPTKVEPTPRETPKPADIASKAVKNNTPTPPRTEPVRRPAKEKPSLNVTYKVQILAYEFLDNTNRRRLERVEELGLFDIERVPVSGKTFTRVMLADYPTLEDAQAVLKQAKNRSFKDAFVVRYENGKRTN